ncbi:MAG TPA: hypothetical protein VK939_05170 [Longimicrobiales bacterium]|nr:hypothetical protein [Longimicrobiales bacterium]
MPEAWELYYDEVYRRAARVADQRFDRGRAFAEAAHEAYRTVANRLSNEAEWSDDHTLHVMHGLNAAMKQWIDCGECSWDDLRARLRKAWGQATESRPTA